MWHLKSNKWSFALPLLQVLHEAPVLLQTFSVLPGQPEQQLPIVDPEAPQWSTGNATYEDLRLLLREIRTAAVAR